MFLERQNFVCQSCENNEDSEKFLQCFLSQSLNPPLLETPGSAPALHDAINDKDRNLFQNHTKEIYLNKFTFDWK